MIFRLRLNQFLSTKLLDAKQKKQWINGSIIFSSEFLRAAQKWKCSQWWRNKLIVSQVYSFATTVKFKWELINWKLFMKRILLKKYWELNYWSLRFAWRKTTYCLKELLIFKKLNSQICLWDRILHRSIVYCWVTWLTTSKIPTMMMKGSRKTIFQYWLKVRRRPTLNTLGK